MLLVEKSKIKSEVKIGLKFYINVIFILLSTTYVYAQDFYLQETNLINYNTSNEVFEDTTKKTMLFDVIVFKSGEEVESKIILVSDNEIHYKRIDFLDGPSFVANKKDVFMIKYSNGQKEIINSSSKNQLSNADNLEMERKAETDANQNFRRGGSFAAGLSTFILTPIFALIPTAIINSFEPNESKLNYPDSELFNNNSTYNTTYRKTAHKLKKQSVWTGYALGAFINVAAALIIYIQ